MTGRVPIDVARRFACVGAALAACLALAGPARASQGQEMILQDDAKLVYEDSPSALDDRLARLKSMGVDRIRVALLWNLVAPNSTSRTRPAFPGPGASFPGSYPPGAWDRYDRIVESAARHGLAVLFTAMGPAPAWAVTSASSPLVTRPNPGDYGAFVAAAGRRYSGGATDRDGRPIPRVDHWSIWNEPNFPSWLRPQWKNRRAQSPRLYRGLVDGAWSALSATGHSGDVILLGETSAPAPPRRGRLGARSRMGPVTFVQGLYCVSSRWRPLRGRAAQRLGCPRTHSGRARFASAHPGLFHASGWAHHPYTLYAAPIFKSSNRNTAFLGAISRLSRALDRSQRRWARLRRLPLWITEYGYETPPDPLRFVSFARQAAWMSWSEYLAFRNRRIASFAQFLLYDDGPSPGAGIARWRTFQTGLLSAAGNPKPSYYEFSLPIFVSPRTNVAGRRIRVFGAYRPGGNAAPIAARIEFARPGHGWRVLRFATITNLRNYWSLRLSAPGTGKLRIVWTDPGSGADRPSRAVALKG